jgi:predicted DNA binding CopG/RHH family protein
MKKRLPKMKTDRAARALLKQELSDFTSPDVFKATSFEFSPKDKSVTLRMSSELLGAVQSAAKKRKTNYQKIIREAIELFLKKAE